MALEDSTCSSVSRVVFISNGKKNMVSFTGFERIISGDFTRVRAKPHYSLVTLGTLNELCTQSVEFIQLWWHRYSL